MKTIKLKILRKGDVVVNSMAIGDGVGFLLKRKLGNLDMVIISRNSDGIPHVSAIWEIEEGNSEVTVEKKGISISTF